MALPLIFDFYNSIIEVPAPDTTLTMQYLIDQIRDTEDELNPGMAYKKIADASGKEDLGGGVSTAITVRLLDNWRVRFEARNGDEGTIQCTISGGNLVGGPSGNPVAPSAYTQVLNLSSAAGTIATPTTANENTNIKYLLASMGAHKAIGNIYYWDPHSGSDTNTGLTPNAAVQTFAKVITLVTTGNHDVIFCLSSHPSGITTVNETINININTLTLKGPGYPFQITPTTPGNPTVAISGNDVEISGFYITTAAGGTDNGITVTGDSDLIKDCWIKDTTGNGIDISSSSRTIVDTCAVEDCAGYGINIGDYTTLSTVRQCIVTGSGTVPLPFDGIRLSGSNSTDNIFENNIIYNNTSYGINIGTGVVRTGVRLHNTFSGNTSGSTYSTGSVGTFIDTAGAVTGDDITNIVNGVWDAAIGSHVGAGTTGRTLKDAKTKATLASLK